jgi:hypothetical protein
MVLANRRSGGQEGSGFLTRVQEFRRLPVFLQEFRSSGGFRFLQEFRSSGGFRFLQEFRSSGGMTLGTAPRTLLSC